ncbi:hypothetical protein [Thalassoroseus pseudoceratinae]|uniref:hypothetical protein n=1 Tax=Thalassoroseus pseudoceratinae TaxID=2713176 RepID=UPI00141E078C|nr:hypothetical protein [Thalassoroseus pseudoceratinae]
MSLVAKEILHAAEIRQNYGIELIKLSQSQRNLIESGQYSQLIETLQHKQCILDRLHDSTSPNNQRLKEWPRVRQTLSPNDRSLVESKLSEVEQLFSELAQEETHCQELLMAQRDQTAIQLKKLSQNSNVRAAYQAMVSSEPASRIDIVK